MSDEGVQQGFVLGEIRQLLILSRKESHGQKSLEEVTGGVAAREMALSLVFLPGTSC